MLTVLKLREMAADEADIAREIMEKADSEGRGLTKDEADAFDSHHKKAEELEAQANRQERQEKLDARLTEPQDRQSTPAIATGEQIEVAGPQAQFAGTLATYRIRVANPGTATARSVTVSAALPRDATHVHFLRLRAD